MTQLTKPQQSYDPAKKSLLDLASKPQPNPADLCMRERERGKPKIATKKKIHHQVASKNLDLTPPNIF